MVEARYRTGMKEKRQTKRETRWTTGEKIADKEKGR